MGWMPQSEDKDWLNGYKNKIPTYAVYKRPTSKQETYTDWNWRARLVVLNSLSFGLYVKLLISPSYLNEIFAGYSNLDCRFFSFITLSISCHFLLSWRVSVERSSVILMGIPLCVICCFSLAVFNICSSLIWLICVLGCFFSWVYPVRDSLGFLDLGGYFLPHFREVFK